MAYDSYENKQQPVFPQTETIHTGFDAAGNKEYTTITVGGMSNKFYAAIALKIPDSGEEWLDEMIRKANRRETYHAIMQGLLSSSNLRSEFTNQTDSTDYVIPIELVKIVHGIADEFFSKEN